MEFFERGGGYTWLAILAVSLSWTGALFRTILARPDYGQAHAGGWLMLGGVLSICLAAATLVPPHTSVLMTVYSGLGPPVLLVMGMSILIVLDGVAEWYSPPPAHPRSPLARWAIMALILSGLGLLMELRAALAIHLAVSPLSVEEATASVERWYKLAHNTGCVVSLIGLWLLIDGIFKPWLNNPDSEPDSDSDSESDDTLLQ